MLAGKRILITGGDTGSPSVASGDGNHMLPIKAGVRRAIGKSAGDRVTVALRTRLR